jgi:hypothetical protein
MEPVEKICADCRRQFSALPHMFDCDCGGKMYSHEQALQRLRDLAHVMAYEAGVVSAHVDGYAKVPAGLKAITDQQIERMEKLARSTEPTEGLGHNEAVMLIRSAQQHLGHEATTVDEQLAYKTFPKSRRSFGEKQSERLRFFARGGDPHTHEAGYHHTWKHALKTLKQTPASATA